MSKPIEIMARGLAKQRIIDARRFDTEPKELERKIPASVQHAWPEFISEAQAALDALAAAGYVVVPKEPTGAMVGAAQAYFDSAEYIIGNGHITAAYRAMIAAGE